MIIGSVIPKKVSVGEIEEPIKVMGYDYQNDIWKNLRIDEDGHLVPKSLIFGYIEEDDVFTALRSDRKGFIISKEESKDYRFYELDLSVARTDQVINLPFYASTINIIRNDAEDWQITLRLEDGKDPIPLPKVIPPIIYTIKYETNSIYLSNPSLSGKWLYLVIFK